MSRQHDDAREAPGDDGAPGDAGDVPADAGPADPAETGSDDEVWLETQRWIDEWGAAAGTARVPGASVGDAPAAAEDLPPGQLKPSESWWSPAPEPPPDAAPDPASEAAPPADAGAAAPGDAPAPDADVEGATTAGPQTPPNGWPAGYVPPSSPAYSASPTSTGPHYVRSRPDPAPEPAPPAAPLARADADHLGLTDVPTRRGTRAGHLLFAGLAIAVVALATAALVSFTGDQAQVYTFGTVREVAAGTTMRTADADEPLAEGDEVTAGSVVQLPADGSVTIELSGGGVVRLDTGARLAFVDDAADPETGEAAGDNEPALEMSAGRAWINPPDGTPIEVRLAGGRVTTEASPLAVECAAECSVESPAGGVEIDADAGGTARPVAGEVVTVRSGASLALGEGTAVTEWAQQNLDADASAHLPEPEPTDDRGVRASAVLDGSYPFRIDVVSGPDGDALPSALVYSAGETYNLQLGAAGSACPPTSCDVEITAADGAAGTARVSHGTIDVAFDQQIDCYDESYTNVVVPGIGTTTVAATLTVAGVVDEGGRWRITSFSGPGTITTTLTTPCNAGDVLGTSTSTTNVTGG